MSDVALSRGRRTTGSLGLVCHRQGGAAPHQLVGNMLNPAEKDRSQNEKILRVVKESPPKDFQDASTLPLFHSIVH